MESSELLRWTNEQIRLRHDQTRDFTVENFFSDWSDGFAYHSILYNYRPDLTTLDFCAQPESNQTLCEKLFEVYESQLGIKRLFHPKQLEQKSAALENITYVGAIHCYFHSNNYKIDKELGKVCVTPCYEVSGGVTPEVTSEDAAIRLSTKLFARKSLEERIEILSRLDGVVLDEKKSSEMTIAEESENSDGNEDQSAAETNPFSSEKEQDKQSEKNSDSDETNNLTDDASVNNKSVNNKSVNNNNDSESSGNEINEDKNPFGEEESEINQTADSTNPFGEDFSDEEGDQEGENPPGNPFGSEEEEEHPPGNPFGDFEEVVKKAPPRPSAPPKRPPPPKLRPKKKQAPLPPVDAVPFDPSRPRRPPPPRPKEKAPGHGHPLIKRDVENNEEKIKSEMSALEAEMSQLETQGAKLEDMLRFSDNSGQWGQDDDGLMTEWLSIVKKRNELGRRDTELGYRLRLTRLEMKHAELELEMRKLLSKPVKSPAEEEAEARIMSEIVAIVDKKDKIVQNLEEERERADIEDSAMSAEPKVKIKDKKTRKSVSIKKIKSVLGKKKDKKKS